VILLVESPLPAAAHTRLIATQPAIDGRLGRTPSQVVLTFNGPRPPRPLRSVATCAGRDSLGRPRRGPGLLGLVVAVLRRTRRD
jgi:methionine-rich copper-binding protein CopC